MALVWIGTLGAGCVMCLFIELFVVCLLYFVIITLVLWICFVFGLLLGWGVWWVWLSGSTAAVWFGCALVVFSVCLVFRGAFISGFDLSFVAVLVLMMFVIVVFVFILLL